MDNTAQEQVNQILALMANEDKRLADVLDAISSATEVLSSDTSNDAKYKCIISVEYLFVKARINVEFEHIKVKSILTRTDLPPYIKAQFTKRDQYLAQVSLKLNTIREDIAVLQKTVYTSEFNFRK